jgi:hypothetical protein
MFLESKDKEMLSLALALENGILVQAAKADNMPLMIAESTVDRYTQNALVKLTNKEGLLMPLTAKTIKLISPTELWALNYLAVKKVLSNGGQQLNELPYTLMCAFSNFREKNPGNDEALAKLNLVEVTNVVFATEFDMIFALIGIEHLLSVLRVMNAAKVPAL